MEKKRTLCYILSAIIFIVALVYFGVLSFLLPAAEYSEVERRDLAKKPEFSLQSYFGKKYTSQFDNFYADTFPGREGFIRLSYQLDSLKGVEGEVKFYQPSFQEEQSEPSSFKPAPSSEPEPSSSVTSPSQSESSSESSSQSESTSESKPEEVPLAEAVDDNAYLNNNMFIYNGAAYQLFYGSDAAAENFANIVSSYAAELPNCRVFTQVVPQPFNFYLPSRYRKMGVDEQKYAEHLHSKLTNGAQGIKVYEKLEQNKDQYLYFRTDTHWTVRGAYSAYQAFCETAGFTPVPLETMERRQVPGDFLGYLYTLTMDSTLAKNPDFVEYFIVPGVVDVKVITDRNGASTLTHLDSLWAEWCRGGNSYSTFIYGDLPYMQVKTSAGTGKSALLIKDSYGNAFAPFLVSHYDTVHILDERYFPYSVYELIEKYGIDDVIISQSSYSANSNFHQQNLKTIKKDGHTGKPLPDWENPPAPPASSAPQESEAAPESESDFTEE